jgi:anti-sigma factor RsiW
MSDCRRVLDRLTPYTDKALAADERAEIEQHLGACPPCRTAALQEEGGRTVLQTRGDRLKAGPVPPGLRSRCEALARRRGDTETRGWVTRLIPAALTAVLIVFTAAALFSLATHQSNTLLAAQLTMDHSKCFRLFASEGDPSVEAPAVEQMLEERHGWDVHVPPSNSEADLQLIGARRCLYADGRIPHVMYRAKGQDVSLYMLEGVSRDDADVLTLGHRSLIWTRGATTYVLVHDQDAEDMQAVEGYVMREAR